jgi:uncharacterized protein (DUF2147 family)
MLTAGAHAADEADADAIVGEWLSDEEESVIEMYKLGDKYYGKVTWLVEPNYPDGTDKVDHKNPDVAKRSRKLVGMDVVSNFESGGKNKWSNGIIYDPNNGKTYSCKARLEGDKLNVRGFIGISLFGRTTVWTRKR